jgi:hypothetical protein
MDSKSELGGAQCLSRRPSSAPARVENFGPMCVITYILLRQRAPLFRIVALSLAGAVNGIGIVATELHTFAADKFSTITSRICLGSQKHRHKNSRNRSVGRLLESRYVVCILQNCFRGSILCQSLVSARDGLPHTTRRLPRESTRLLAT